MPQRVEGILGVTNLWGGIEHNRHWGNDTARRESVGAMRLSLARKAKEISTWD